MHPIKGVFSRSISDPWSDNRVEASFTMPRKDVKFQTFDRLTLRGWLSALSLGSDRVLSWRTALQHHKELNLKTFAEYFTSNLPIAVLAYDHRCIGASDGKPTREIIPSLQINDYSDGITFA